MKESQDVRAGGRRLWGLTAFGWGIALYGLGFAGLWIAAASPFNSVFSWGGGGLILVPAAVTLAFVGAIGFEGAARGWRIAGAIALVALAPVLLFASALFAGGMVYSL
jgi:hypothetical protein